MKHLFVIHSHITHLVSLSIIRFLNLSENEVRLITFNPEFKPYPQIYRITYFDENKKRGVFKSLGEKVKKGNYVKYLDDKLHQLTEGEDFILYANSLSVFNRLIVTNSQCRGFSFFEEGMDNYKKNTLQSYTKYSKSSYRIGGVEKIKSGVQALIDIFRGRVTHKLNFLPADPVCYSGFDDVRYFVFSELAFQGVPLEKKIKLEFSKLPEIFIGFEIQNLSNSVIFIGDNVVNFFGISVTSYVQAIKKGIERFMEKETISRIYVKFHQRENASSREATIQLFKEKRLEVVFIDESIELILLGSKNVTLLGLTSSLLWYASLLGHSSYSINNYLDEHMHLSGINFFWEKVKLL